MEAEIRFLEELDHLLPALFDEAANEAALWAAGTMADEADDESEQFNGA